MMKSEQNDRVRRDLNYAIAAVFNLDHSGAEIRAVRVERGQAPLIRVDKRPACLDQAAAAVRVQPDMGLVCWADLHGCIVEWPACTEVTASLATEGGDDTDGDTFAERCKLVARCLRKTDGEISAHQIARAIDLPIRAVRSSLHELIRRKRAARVHCPDGILRYLSSSLGDMDSQPMRLRVRAVLESAEAPMRASEVRELVFGRPVDAYSKQASRVSSALYALMGKDHVVGNFGESVARRWFLIGSAADPNQQSPAPLGAPAYSCRDSDAVAGAAAPERRAQA